jgi:hypothetical protein
VIVTQSQIESNFVGQRPGILNPKLFPPPNETVIGITIHDRSDWIARRRISIKNIQPRLVDGLRPINLESRFDDVLTIRRIGVVETKPPRIGGSVLIGRGKRLTDVPGIRQKVQRVRLEHRTRMAKIAGQTEKILGINVVPPHHVAILVIFFLKLVDGLRSDRTEGRILRLEK